jgi:hypothetical protein
MSRGKLARYEDLDRRIDRHRRLAEELDTAMDARRKPAKAKLRLEEAPMTDTPSSFVSEDSSSILGASYDGETRVLTVKIKPDVRGKSTTPKTYQYEDFSLALWQQFCQAESKGSYFNTHIRPYFKGVAV